MGSGQLDLLKFGIDIAQPYAEKNQRFIFGESIFYVANILNMFSFTFYIFYSMTKRHDLVCTQSADKIRRRSGSKWNVMHLLPGSFTKQMYELNVSAECNK